MAERLLKLGDVCDRVGFGKSALYEMIADGEFPAPKKVRGSSRWREAEVDAWIVALPSANGDHNGDHDRAPA